MEQCSCSKEDSVSTSFAAVYPEIIMLVGHFCKRGTSTLRTYYIYSTLCSRAQLLDLSVDVNDGTTVWVLTLASRAT